MAMAYRYWTTKRILKWSLLFAYLENKEDECNLIGNADSPLASEFSFPEIQEIQKSLPVIPSTISRFNTNSGAVLYGNFN
ncbi:hypothetical protein TSUD_120680 [Trifolium subterraneum]|uniref:Uncharacterized protein n=1 Tax=Trifolium subterraneum TaxID=3900 RepID=A0A2Z6LV59_TRISU|nr:hypothetical protein TSUD_120680 [Trifolium subterraneum]